VRKSDAAMQKACGYFVCGATDAGLTFRRLKGIYAASREPGFGEINIFTLFARFPFEFTE